MSLKMSLLDSYFEENDFSELYEEVSGFMEHIANINDGYVMPKYPLIERRATSFFFDAIRQGEPDLLGLALTAGLSEREFFDISQKFNHATYMQTAMEIIETAFKKQSEEICFLRFLAKVLGHMATYHLVCRNLYHDFKLKKAFSNDKKSDIL